MASPAALLSELSQFTLAQVDEILHAERLQIPMPGTPQAVQDYLAKVALRVQSVPNFLVQRTGKESK
eukprot:9976212-Lingulodinium_polyedra.AAC.1